jgi:ATP-dependent DNA helicase HFM1/MER3
VDSNDRILIETHYLKGDINVICCTSTLAVGVNLPCHMVIIKGTISYAGDGVSKELSELDVLQMMGRAGRPQFDTTAVSVILTRFDSVSRWDKLVSGQEILESR